MATLNIEIMDAKKPDKCLFTINNVGSFTNVFVNEWLLLQPKKRYLTVDRQSLRLSAKGKGLVDDQLVADLNLPAKGAQLFLRDLGPQIAWKTVFLAEYTGPLFVYPIFYMRPGFIYGSSSFHFPISFPVHLALICWTVHYAKRLFETQFVHRFSNATMPRFNILKNCAYYWGFAAFLSYFVNHPLYTEPYYGDVQVFTGLICFLLSEYGNYSIHIALRDLRPKGTRQRKIPMPNESPFTLLFNLVSCPNYTYEFMSWVSFAFMVQSLPVLIFAVIGFIQMSVWALNKHKAYIKEFRDYPRFRKAILPFIL